MKKISTITICLCLLLKGFSSQAQNVTFSDINLKNALLSDPSINIDSDLEIQLTEAHSFTGTVSVSGWFITDMTGIEEFTAMTGLDCSFNQLSILNLSANTSLIHLNCIVNQISALTLPLSGSLTKVIAGANLLSTINNNDAANLDTLDIQNNQFTSLDVSQNPNLKDLNCSVNQLNSINLTSTSQLLSLNCSTNQLAVLDLSSCNSLQSLNAGSNLLSNLNLSANTNLLSLDLSLNSITSLDLSLQTQLVNISCNDNVPLSSLSIKNGNNLNLVQFYANSNPNLHCIQVDSVEYMNTNWSSAKDPGASFSEDCGNFLYIPDGSFKAYLLAEPTINTNQDSEIQLTEAAIYSGSIYAGGLGISDLTGIEAFTQITALACSSNLLTTLNVSANTNLTSLSCNNNQLMSLDVSTLSGLAFLDCSNNSIASLDVAFNPSLLYLGCSNNQLNTLNVSSNTALTQLYCSNNNLNILDVSANLSLTNLWCNTNLLSAIDVSLNTALTNFNCSSNPIGDLNLSANTALQSLTCSDNQLNTLDISANTALIGLESTLNPFTSLDVSSNTLLTSIYLFGNQLNSLDVSSNTALTYLNCALNHLTGLDLTANSGLTILNCSDNQLTSLNIQNGNNLNLSIFNATGNSSLTCIQVDDVGSMNITWSAGKDAGANFSTACTFSCDLFASSNGTIGTCAAGSLQITNVTGGSGFYEFSIASANGGYSSTWQADSTFLNVPPDIYYVYMRNSLDTTCSIMIGTGTTVPAPPALNAIATPYLGTCAAGSIIMSNQSGGNSGIYQYKIISRNGGYFTSWQSNDTFSLVPIDQYEVWMRDAVDTSCIYFLGYPGTTVPSPPPLNAIATPYLGTCAAGSIIMSNQSGGNSGIYQYKIISRNGGYFTSWQLNDTFSLVPIDQYEVWMRDAVDTTCIYFLGYPGTTVPSPPALAAIATPSSTSCSSGSITMSNVSGGNSGQYQYRITSANGGYYTSWQSSVTFSNVPADQYYVYLRDAVDTSCTTFLGYPGVFLTYNVNIPDSIFKAYLLNDTLINTNKDSLIQCAEASIYTGVIDVSNLGIADMTGIEAFMNISGLNVNNNPIHNLNLTSNAALTQLQCSNAQLSNLALNSNINLSEIDCSNNQLNALDVTMLPYLFRFNCELNSIGAIDISQNVNLHYLSIGNNQLTSLVTQANNLLTELHCEHNQLVVLNFSSNYSLLNVTCNDNPLIYLNVQNGNNLNFIGFNATNCPTLTCIQVDDVAGMNLTWSIGKDVGASFSLNCGCAPGLWFLDLDNDGYGNPTIDSISCAQPVGYVLNNTDCNDNDVLAHAAPGSSMSIYSSVTSFCNGTSGHSISANANPQQLTYHWTVNGTGITTSAINNETATETLSFSLDNNISIFDISVYAYNSCGSSQNSAVNTFQVYQIPDSAGAIAGVTSVSACANQLGITYSVPPIAHASHYDWTLPPLATIIGNPDTNSITVNYSAFSNSGNVTVTGRNSASCSGITSSLFINFAPIPHTEICSATVDSATQYSIIYWQKPTESYVNAYVIYREISGVYTALDTIPNTAFSSYTDLTSRPDSFPENYKIATLDSCGNQTSISSSFKHQTIHLLGAVLLGGNAKLYWNDYQGMSDPNRYYNLLRDTLGNGAFTDVVAGHIAPPPAGTTMLSVVDNTAANYPICRYVVEMVYTTGCIPSQKVMTGLSTTRSDIKNQERFLDSTMLAIALPANNILNEIGIYPNPAKDLLTLSNLDPKMTYQMQLYNAIGQSVLNEEIRGRVKNEISLIHYPEGLYILHLTTGGKTTSIKLKIEAH